jgi:hypothetical protein
MSKQHEDRLTVEMQRFAELRRQQAVIEELREAIKQVLVHLHDTPTTGYLRDNDASRGALKSLAAALAKAEAQQ